MWSLAKHAGWALAGVLLLTGCGGGGGGGSAGGSTSSTSSSAASAVGNEWFPGTLGKVWSYRLTPVSGAVTTSVATVTSSDASGFLVKYQYSDTPTQYSTTRYAYSGSALVFTTSQSRSVSPDTLISESTYTPGGLVVPSSMLAGVTESTTSARTGPAATSVRSITVNGTETVTVPAGTFSATKITLTVTETLNGSPFVGTTVYWYVKNVGRVKISNSSGVTELVSVGSAPSSSSSASASSVSSSSSSSSSSAATSTTSLLGITFTQGGSSAALVTTGGIPTVTLHNTPFQILIPAGSYPSIFIRAVTDNSGSVDPAGNVMAKYFDETSSIHYIAAVGSGDTSVNGFSYASDTTASGGVRVLNIKEIRNRFSSSPTTYTTLYFQFYLPTSPSSAVERETIKVILN